MHTPDLNTFLKLTQKGNLIPVYKEILGDLETPVSAHYKLAHDAKYAFLLESVEGEEKVARYSFLAKDPELVFECKGSQVIIRQFTKGREKKSHIRILGSPLSYLREIMKQYAFIDLPELPRFCGGMVGYMGYDAVRFFEKIPVTTKDDLKLPDMIFALVKDIIIFDHLNHTIKVVSCVHVDKKSSRRKKSAAYRQAVQHIDALIHQLNTPLKHKHHRQSRSRIGPVRSNISEREYRNIVTKAKRQIRAGEIIQVVLSQRFEVPLKTDPFNIYRTLRSVNPSPYMYHLRFGDIQIIGSSPELLVRCENRLVETRPIAGTRPRGRDTAEDERYKHDLLNDPKEKAEHIMLVDLGRNDLGRVSKAGTVRVSEFMIVEKYSHVMHIVSNVQGHLRSDKDIFDVLQAAFPAGTVSGSPKIRAMEIIDDLEKVHRGPYAGCIGYFSFSGNLDSCITIRTVVIKGKRAYIQAGAGIVADSKPKNEYLETKNKAKAQVAAIEMAHHLNQ